MDTNVHNFRIQQAMGMVHRHRTIILTHQGTETTGISIAVLLKLSTTLLLAATAVARLVNNFEHSPLARMDNNPMVRVRVVG